ncbi:hypothetical protein P8452_61328 [Trifolium repens]|nr:hypothetical protein P8452_61328 [Trifolium repens]
MYPKWPKVPLAKKDLIYDNNIKAKFVVSDTNKFHKKWIYTSLGKSYKRSLGQAKANKNALNRQKQRIPHTLGTRSLARTKDIMEQRDGRSYSRGDMYEISHKRRNGSYGSNIGSLFEVQPEAAMHVGLFAGVPATASSRLEIVEERMEGLPK